MNAELFNKVEDRALRGDYDPKNSTSNQIEERVAQIKRNEELLAEFKKELFTALRVFGHPKAERMYQMAEELSGSEHRFYHIARNMARVVDLVIGGLKVYE